jgi:hypothetical protein
MIRELGSVADPGTVQNIVANGYSDVPWLLSPPSFDSFVETLRDQSSDLRFNMRFSFIHTDASTSEISIAKDSGELAPGQYTPRD